MSSSSNAQSAIDSLVEEAAQLERRVNRFKKKLARAEARLNEVQSYIDAFQPLVGEGASKAAAKAPKAAAKKAAAAPVAEAAADIVASEAPAGAAAEPAAKAPKAAAKKPARKGRRKATGSAAKARGKTPGRKRTGVGIVDTVVRLAQEKAVDTADADTIMGWLAEANYVNTRGVAPPRNSVFVSLDREAKKGADEGNVRISRPERGLFKFH